MSSERWLISKRIYPSPDGVWKYLSSPVMSTLPLFPLFMMMTPSLFPTSLCNLGKSEARWAYRPRLLENHNFGYQESRLRLFESMPGFRIFMRRSITFQKQKEYTRRNKPSQLTGLKFMLIGLFILNRQGLCKANNRGEFIQGTPHITHPIEATFLRRDVLPACPWSASETAPQQCSQAWVVLELPMPPARLPKVSSTVTWFAHSIV
ncbi:hypothetical protein GGU11DRAFT_469447 [Lentinula aff. detonsa]|nr:hypothetical protein GGU11DRAFT_469447 [Lentinula aff. detonsa]